MTKEAIIMLRVEPETKERLERAARMNHETLTTFLVRAGIKEAERVERRGPVAPSARFHGVPTFFRACCQTAAQGGQATYEEPGYHLAIHTRELCEPQGDEEVAGRKLDELWDAVRHDDDTAIIAWYRREFPRCMELVPSKRCAQFVKGVKRACEEERL
jgi:hypothetical protein